MPVSLTNLIKWPRIRSHIYDNPDNFIHDSELMKVVMVRSERGLKHMLAQKQHDYSTGESEGFNLYSLATRLGWAEGCSILWSQKVPLARPNRSDPNVCFNEALLHSAFSANDIETLQFWLSLRDTLSADELYQLGTLEDALDWTVPKLFNAVLEAIVQQRLALQQIAMLHLRPNENCLKSEGLLDAHAHRVLDLLAAKNVIVHPSLRPARRSIWYMDRWRTANEVVWDRLYNKGFRDLTSAHFEIDRESAITPLLYNVNSVERMRAVKWFISKGASLYEKWPNSDTTVLHCLAWTLGRIHHSISEPTALHDLTAFLLDQCSDSCKCRCSTSGCLFITVFGRAFLEHDIEYSWRQRLRSLSALFDPTLASTDVQWLMAEFIRLAVFCRLGLRHTCCDLTRIHHWGSDDPDLSKSPVPRYAAKETARILREDAFLLGLLEELVEGLYLEYNDLKLSAGEFFETRLVPKMDDVMHALAVEDEENYGRGRRELGVIMDSVDCNGSEDEGDNSGQEGSWEEEDIEGQISGQESEQFLHFPQNM
jgi:hypothetical protein